MKKQTEFTIPTSFKDAGYRFARSGETTSSIARWIIDQNPAFLDNASKDEVEELREGWGQRWQDLNPAKRFNTEWIPDDKGGIELSLTYCMSYSQQAFGQLRNENPVQHGCIKGIRDAFNKYVSNQMSNLKREIHKVLRADGDKPKAATKNYMEFVSDTFDTLKARCKTARARKDATAPDEVVLRQAIDAFYAKLK